jgi:hypothetical protein
MQLAITKHNAGEAITIPIILSPVDWKTAPIGKLTVLPSNGVAVSQWSDQDAAWVDVVSGIRKAIEDLRKPSAQTSHDDQQ